MFSGMIATSVMEMEKVSIDSMVAQKMAFIFNALEDGWEVKKKGENYVFKKRHHNRREVFLDTYLEGFIRNNLCMKTLLSSKVN